MNTLLIIKYILSALLIMIFGCYYNKGIFEMIDEELPLDNY
jgi:hypothetical protein